MTLPGALECFLKVIYIIYVLSLHVFTRLETPGEWRGDLSKHSPARAVSIWRGFCASPEHDDVAEQLVLGLP